MLFNSIDFAIFLPVVFILYWFILYKKLAVQNFLILVASYVFYGWWDYRFLILIFFSTVVDFFIGKWIGKETSSKKKKLLLSGSLIINLGLLFFFKYYNFFTESFSEAFSFFGYNLNLGALKIILPVGISFYTFQTLSYTIDVYRNKLVPAKNFIDFASFVSFFPQLVAGPIERATNLLPQFYKKRDFNYELATGGLKLILWGLFKKIVIADNCADYANLIFNNHAEYPGSMLLIGAIFFAFQIYGDFSGYSDIAIGTSRLFGFDLMRNFSYPYFSRNIGEFWRRWHISLSTWFRDYLYIPLGGSRGSTWIRIRNTFIIFIVSGFWHGANWTFIIWGALNALYFLPLLLLNSNRKYLDTVGNGSVLPGVNEISKIFITFFFTVIAWIFFRSESVSQAIEIISEIFSSSLIVLPNGSYFIGGSIHVLWIFILLIFFIIIEWHGRDKECPIFIQDKVSYKAIRWLIYLVLSILILSFQGEEQEFIYFQF